MKLVAKAKIEIDRPRGEVFEYLVNNDTYPRILLPKWPIAGIAFSELIDADKLAPGVRREVGMTDGTVIEEQILQFDRPSAHRYSWVSGLEPPFSLVVKTGEANWRFSTLGDRTKVDWTYTFDLTNALVYPLVRLLMIRFQAWMDAGLANAKIELERATIDPKATV